MGEAGQGKGENNKSRREESQHYKEGEEKTRDQQFRRGGRSRKEDKRQRVHGFGRWEGKDMKRRW